MIHMPMTLKLTFSSIPYGRNKEFLERFCLPVVCIGELESSHVFVATRKTRAPASLCSIKEHGIREAICPKIFLMVMQVTHLTFP